MAKGAEYRIKKLEKGPLQRFKNQNHLVKKFGEVGIQVYKAITGKRTTAELQKDLDIEKNLFDQIISYMEEAGMAELEPLGEAPKSKKEPKELEELPEEPEEEEPPLEEEPEHEEEPEESIPEKKPKKPARKAEPDEFEIQPIEFDEIKPIETDIGEEPPEEHEEEPKEEPEEEPEDEFKPISAGEPEEEPEEKPMEEYDEEPEEKPLEEYDENSEEEPPISAFEQEEEPYEEGSDLSPVEKIISDKYGDIGLRVYALIDGQRTAEEIMQDTGLTETKLVEILDFMDEQGIIKLDYPKRTGGGAQPPSGRSFAQAPPPPRQEESSMGFVPMIDNDERLDDARGILSPVEMPIKAPVDIVKSVQMKAKIMLKFGEKGNKVLQLIDGKNDTLDISLKLEIPLYDVMGILTFMLQSGMVIMKPLGRADVRKKYGDDGYSVYKKYGKEGLMLYELIGKEMTIKQMADMITKQKETVIDMFIFIHKVLGIELPIDEDVLKKQLGI
ncbi:hypothetical protein JXA56_02360 [Candidatus Micrarchaeota archaeon]|nr:hypothetical protein [Candidatus Micrarchaeota archaeon]